MIKFILFISALSCFYCDLSWGAEIDKEMNIYYIPFESETYVAVTTENIKLHSEYIFNISAEKDKSNLLDIISKKSSNKKDFTYKRVRLLLKMNDTNNIYVDSDGNVLMPPNQLTLSSKQFKKLNRYLSKLISKYNKN